MKNYFELLEIAEKANVDDIKKKIDECRKRWERISNSAPNVEDRRKAEDNRLLLPEIEKIFSSEESKGKYVSELKAWEEEQKAQAKTRGQQNLRQLLTDAEAFLKQNNYDEACHCFRELFVKDPGNVQACQILLRAYNSSGRKNPKIKAICLEEAEPILATGEEPTIRELLGELYYQDQNWEEAVNTYSGFASPTKEVAEKLANGRLMAGHFVECVNTVKRLIQSFGNNVEYSTLLARAYSLIVLNKAVQFVSSIVPKGTYLPDTKTLLEAKQTIETINSECPHKRENPETNELQRMIERSEEKKMANLPGSIAFTILTLVIFYFNFPTVGMVFLGLSALIWFASYKPIYKIIEAYSNS